MYIYHDPHAIIETFATVSASVFSNNKVRNPRVGLGSGGAVLSVNVHVLNTSTSLFQGNEATASGGAVSFIKSMDYSGDISLAISACSFTANRVPYMGAAVHASRAASLAIFGCAFTSNNIYVRKIIGGSGIGGAGVYASLVASLTVTNSSFVNNTGHSGGGIFRTNWADADQCNGPSQQAGSVDISG